MVFQTSAAGRNIDEGSFLPHADNIILGIGPIGTPSQDCLLLIVDNYAAKFTSPVRARDLFPQ